MIYKVEGSVMCLNRMWVMPILTETVVLDIGALDTVALGWSSTRLLATLKFGFAAAM